MILLQLHLDRKDVQFNCLVFTFLVLKLTEIFVSFLYIWGLAIVSHADIPQS